MKKLHEDNLKCELYHKCKLQNINCVVEWKIQKSRCDAVILMDNKITHIIEIKQNKYKPINWKSKQFIKYKDICIQRKIPFILLTKWSCVDQLVNDLKNNLITECKPYRY